MSKRYKLSFNVLMRMLDNIDLLLKVIAVEILDDNAENSVPNS